MCLKLKRDVSLAALRCSPRGLGLSFHGGGLHAMQILDKASIETKAANTWRKRLALVRSVYGQDFLSWNLEAPPIRLFRDNPR